MTVNREKQYLENKVEVSKPEVGQIPSNLNNPHRSKHFESIRISKDKEKVVRRTKDAKE